MMMKHGKKFGSVLLIAVSVLGISIFTGTILAKAAQQSNSTPNLTAEAGIASRENVHDEKAKENAKEIALKKTDGGTVTQCVFDYEDGRQVYEIEIINGNIEYEMDVDVQDGTITDYDTERIRTNANQPKTNDRYYDHDDWDDDHDDWKDDFFDRDDRYCHCDD